MLRTPVLGSWDNVGETVDPVLVVCDDPLVLVVWAGPVLVANDSILGEELVVEDGAKTYPLRWTAKTLAPSAEMVVVAMYGLGIKST